jgi:hypothetical protein
MESENRRWSRLVLLRNETWINASPEDVFHWLEHIDRNYLEWHPDHVSCRYIKGNALEVGSILFCQEYLHGKPHKFRMRLTRVVPGSRMEYDIGLSMRGAFEVLPVDGGAKLIAEVELGFSLPLAGKAQDALIRKIFTWRIDALEQHMTEEGERLKRIMEYDAENGQVDYSYEPPTAAMTP